ncbi:5'-3' exonuclease H3TH domain-containing protein [Halomonas sp. BMC6]|uniref:5'-3' exonuclease H3TH domain-containing protein n=1 Tax=Halomonas sp. BMC6 TaxID=3073244 RepID=UPI0030CEA14D
MRYAFFDSHAIGYAAQDGMKLTVNDREVQAIFGSIKSVRRYVNELKARPIMLWDGKAKWRYELFADYKSKRGKEPDPRVQHMRACFRDQREDIKRGLGLLGVPSLLAEDFEADDLAGHLVKTYTAQGKHVFMITGDHDWKQLISDKATWVNHKDGRMVHAVTFAENTGYLTPTAFVQGKALFGDNSDEIPGVGRIGEKSAPEILAQYGDVKTFIQRIRDDVAAGRKVPKAYRDFAMGEKSPKEPAMTRIQVFKRNVKLMNLLSGPKPTGVQVLYRDAMDLDGFRDFCREFAFNSILNDFDAFVEPFIDHCVTTNTKRETA